MYTEKKCKGINRRTFRCVSRKNQTIELDKNECKKTEDFELIKKAPCFTGKRRLKNVMI